MTNAITTTTTTCVPTMVTHYVNAILLCACYAFGALP